MGVGSSTTGWSIYSTDSQQSSTDGKLTLIIWQVLSIATAYAKLHIWHTRHWYHANHCLQSAEPCLEASVSDATTTPVDTMTTTVLTTTTPVVTTASVDTTTTPVVTTTTPVVTKGPGGQENVDCRKSSFLYGTSLTYHWIERQAEVTTVVGWMLHDIPFILHNSSSKMLVLTCRDVSVKTWSWPWDYSRPDSKGVGLGIVIGWPVLVIQWSVWSWSRSWVVVFSRPRSSSCKIKISKKVSNEFITREKPTYIKGIRSEARTADRLQMSCEHVSLELRTKTSETISSAYKWRKTVPNGGDGAWEPTSSNVMFVDEDCVDSRSDVHVDDPRTRDCPYGESRQVRYEGCCSLAAL